jgi:hypothetical protein
MKHIKNFSTIRYLVNDITGLFDIESEEYTIELVQEDLTSIKDIIDGEYNLYISSCISIYLYNNILTLENSEFEITINIEKQEFNNLLKYINKYFNKILSFKELSDDDYDSIKLNVEDTKEYLLLLRSTNKYNL